MDTDDFMLFIAATTCISRTERVSLQDAAFNVACNFPKLRDAWIKAREGVMSSTVLGTYDVKPVDMLTFITGYCYLEAFRKNRALLQMLGEMTGLFDKPSRFDRLKAWFRTVWCKINREC